METSHRGIMRAATILVIAAALFSGLLSIYSIVMRTHAVNGTYSIVPAVSTVLFVSPL